MTNQAKRLKQLLKMVGATDRFSRSGNPHVKTETRRLYDSYSGGYYRQYGDAVSHTDALTDEQIEQLKAECEYVKIFNDRELNFAIVRY